MIQPAFPIRAPRNSPPWPTRARTPERKVAEKACEEILYGLTVAEAGARLRMLSGRPYVKPSEPRKPAAPTAVSVIKRWVWKSSLRLTVWGCMAYLRWSTGDADLELEDCW